MPVEDRVQTPEDRVQMPINLLTPSAFAPTENPPIPVSVPTPTITYRAGRKLREAAIEPGRPTPPPLPVPAPFPGARVLIWKQDPSVKLFGIRQVYLPGQILAGPRDARISIEGLSAIAPDVKGDLIQAPDTEAFDAVHTFAVVHQTLTMYRRALGGIPLPWQWNSQTNIDQVQVFPHAGETMNAFYSRDQQALKFFYFHKPGDTSSSAPSIYTCRSLDIVAHETGHAILDALKPGWIDISNPPQTGGLHEAFGDLTAIFLALSQLDQVEAIIAQTKGDLHDKIFLSDVAEEFGLALGRPNGLRNADNDFTLEQVGTEVHSISQVFTGAIYDVLADLFAFERNPTRKDDAVVLFEVAKYLQSVLLSAILAAPDTQATFADVANAMITKVTIDGKPVQYRNFIRNRFAVRKVVTSPTSLTEDLQEGVKLEPAVQDAPEAIQDRRGCCGTMQLAEYTGGREKIEAGHEELKKVVGDGHLTALAQSLTRP